MGIVDHVREVIREFPDDEMEWSRAVEPGTKGEPYRIFVWAETGSIIEVAEHQVTSDTKTARPLGQYVGRLALTTEEAEWLIKTLQKAVRHVRGG